MVGSIKYVWIEKGFKTCFYWDWKVVGPLKYIWRENFYIFLFLWKLVWFLFIMEIKVWCFNEYFLLDYFGVKMFGLRVRIFKNLLWPINIAAEDCQRKPGSNKGLNWPHIELGILCSHYQTLKRPNTQPNNSWLYNLLQRELRLCPHLFSWP